MEKLIQKYIVELGIIAKLPADCSLSTTDSKLSIYKFGLVPWIQRKFTGDGRAAIASYLTDFYSEVREISTHMMETKTFPVALLQGLKEAVDNSQGGLRTLQNKYATDTAFKSSMEMIMTTIISPQLMRMSTHLTDG